MALGLLCLFLFVFLCLAQQNCFKALTMLQLCMTSISIWFRWQRHGLLQCPNSQILVQYNITAMPSLISRMAEMPLFQEKLYPAKVVTWIAVPWLFWTGPMRHKERLLWEFLLGCFLKGDRGTLEVSLGCFRDAVLSLRQLRIFQAH